MSKSEETSPKTNEAEAAAETETADSTGKKTGKFVVASQIRDLVKAKGFCVGGDLIDALSSKVEALLETAALRADRNGRKTLRSHDL